MGTLRIGIRGVSARTLYSRMTRKPLKKLQSPAPKPRSRAAVGSECPRIFAQVGTCYSKIEDRSKRACQARRSGNVTATSSICGRQSQSCYQRAVSRIIVQEVEDGLV